MTYTLTHKDIAGATLTVGDHCIVTEHNRLILARVTKVYDSNKVQLQPLNSSAGDRRGTPKQTPIRRDCYNVYKLADSAITMSILKGAI